MADEPRRQLRRRTRALLDLAALSETVVMLALYYLRRASQLTPSADEDADVFCSADQQVLAALVCAQKYHEDAAYTNRTWSELSGVEITQISRLERNLLVRLRHELCVDPQEFSRWSGEVRRWASLSAMPATGMAENELAKAMFHPHPGHCTCATCGSLSYISAYGQHWSPPQLTQVVMHMPVSTVPSYAPYFAVPYQMPSMVPAHGIWAMPSA